MNPRRLRRAAVAGAVVALLGAGVAACDGRSDGVVGAPTRSATAMPQDDLDAFDATVGDGEDLAGSVESELVGDDG